MAMYLLTNVLRLHLTGILCPHRGAVFSYTYRHEAFPYETDDRETCNIFFVWEMLRPLLKGDILSFFTEKNTPKKGLAFFSGRLYD